VVVDTVDGRAGFCGVRGAARLVLVPDVERTRAVVDMVAYFSCCKLLIQW
jgi:hypothetical protein